MQGYPQAIKKDDMVVIAAIQVRRWEGIVGTVAPTIYESNAGRSLAELDPLFIASLRDPELCVDDLAIQLYRLMKAK
jgi:hypothetical protein